MNYFKVNMLFSNKQFGFIKGRSTTLQLLQFLNTWTEWLEQGGQVDVVYTDLEKAFDKIPHKRLISNLHSYGLHKEIIEWLEAFLTNRKQRLRIQQLFQTEQPLSVEYHKVQSYRSYFTSVFIIYINNLVEYCNSGPKIFLFADDAKIFSYIKRKKIVKSFSKT